MQFYFYIVHFRTLARTHTPLYSSSPGYYHPDHATHSSQQTKADNTKAGPPSAGNAQVYNNNCAACSLQQTEAGNAEAGPPSAGNTQVYDDNVKEALSTLRDKDNEDNQMGPT